MSYSHLNQQLKQLKQYVLLPTLEYRYFIYWVCLPHVKEQKTWNIILAFGVKYNSGFSLGEKNDNWVKQKNILNEGITMCLEIKYYNISVRQHNLFIYL